MKFSIFSLHPDIFTSFFETSLIARGIEQKVISYELINWRQNHGIGKYKQVDDKPYGGGTGMVLMCEPIFKALLEKKSLGYQLESFALEVLQEIGGFDETSYNLDDIYSILSKMEETEKLKNLSYIVSHTQRIYPPNNDFIDFKQKNPGKKNITISMTPKGYPFSQPVAQYLADEFDDISIICGRYEGLDARMSECVDLEISMGPYITNGGEVPAMALMESVSRLVPGFVTKRDSVLHDSFSLTNNFYTEQKEFIFGKKRLESKKFADSDEIVPILSPLELFDDILYRDDILPKLEHPVFTKPSSWRGLEIPQVLLSGDHKKIHNWRNNWNS